MKTKQIEFFNEWAKKYLLNNVPQYIRLVNDIHTDTKKIKPRNVFTYADLGTGTGVMALMAQDYYSASKSVYVYDVSKAMLKIVKKRWEENKFDNKKLHAINADFENIKLPINKFDVVYASFSLHHVPHERKSAIIAKIYQSLKQNGLFVLGETMFESQGSVIDIAWIYIKKALNGLMNVGLSQCFKEIGFFFQIIRHDGEYMATKEMWEKKIFENGFKILISKFSNKYLTYGYIISKK